MGRSPTLIENQVTYPIATSFLGAPNVKTVRGFTSHTSPAPFVH
jgi:Cu(I)/Ag(I) efflux system membrane protein CusA/SilA